MPTTIFGSVRPGDVISSDLMNYVLTKLVEIDGRVSDLEQGGSSTGGVSIAGFDPPHQINAGQELAVFGANFDFPPTSNIVTIDGVPITSFRQGNTSTVLRFIVPTTLSIPAGGKNVTIYVRNSLGHEKTALYRVLPAVQAPGDPPAITAITPLVGDFRFVNQPILITGQNFAVDPLENIIRFQLTLAGGTVVYPKDGQMIQINDANSNTAQIECTVPDIAEIPAGQNRQVTVSVGVGAHVPAQLTVSIRRP